MDGGSWYSGYWHNGEKDGIGRVKKPNDNKIEEGIWKNGKRVVV